MKIPFDIKFRPQIESGEYRVVTTKEQSVRIICWDRSTTYWKIIALVLAPDGETENPFTYDVNGKESDGCLHNHDLDLYLITPEPELSEFEKGYMRIVHKMKPEDFNDDGLKIAKEEAAELLDLARKEIMDGWSNGLRDTQDQSGKAYSDGYKLGFEKGKAEALKEIEQDPESSYAFKRGVEYGKEEALNDLPRWKPAAVAYDGDRLPKIDWSLKRLVAKFEEGVFYLDINDLYKLPGFNE